MNCPKCGQEMSYQASSNHRKEIKYYYDCFECDISVIEHKFKPGMR